MTILSDRQIRLLCVPPARMFDRALYDTKMNQQSIAGWPLIAAACATIKHRLTEESWRPTTEEERAAFVPMISPFTPEQVKTVEHAAPRVAYEEHLAQLVDAHPEEPVSAELQASLKAQYGVGTTRKIISRGTTSYGYDVSLSGEFQIFTNVNGAHIDPKRPNPACLIDATLQTDEYGDEFVWLPPNSYLLGWTEEYFRIPRNVVAICVGKSTYARAGVQVNVTPIEPGFQGTVVIEIANSTSLPVKIYAHEGISQFIFLQGDEECETSYADRNGKYQGQVGIKHATV